MDECHEGYSEWDKGYVVEVKGASQASEEIGTHRQRCLSLLACLLTFSGSVADDLSAYMISGWRGLEVSAMVRVSKLVKW